MNSRKRTAYVTATQKQRLKELMAKHPELVSGKITPEFRYSDSQRLWQYISTECNAIPGAKKTWKQWRKTWQDIHYKTKKYQTMANGLPSVFSTEQEATEFIPIEQDKSIAQDSFGNDVESHDLYSEPESPPETKVFSHTHKNTKKVKSTKHTNDCSFNCDLLVAQEQHKVQIKEDYINFKKKYLTQKLELLREQTEALKSIARQLSK